MWTERCLSPPRSAARRPATDVDVDEALIEAMSSYLRSVDNPYGSTMLPVELLADVYENSLGEVICIGPERTVFVESKPATKRATGVYYTPEHIVAHVVERTLGTALRDKSVAEVASLRVLDPACGCGPFLLGAFRLLLDWYRERYLESRPAPDGRHVRRTSDGRWALTAEERTRILRRHIYGVDIDPRAVEICRRSLLLTSLAADGHIGEPTSADLRDNIQCGNALVSGDFYRDLPPRAASAHPPGALRPFDWSAFAGGGRFDVVLGNPPWGQKGIMEAAAVKKYIRANYPSTAGIYDLFRPFVEKAVRLTGTGGYFGMVLPDVVLLKNYQETRRYLLENLTLTAIDWWGMAFSTAVIDTTTIVGYRGKAPADHRAHVTIRDPEGATEHLVPQADFWNNPRHTFNLLLTPEKRAIIARLDGNPKLGDYYEAHEGVHSGNMRSELFVTGKLDESCRELYFGRDEISPFHLRWRGRYVRLGVVPKKKTRKRYANPGQPEWFTSPKVLVRRTGDYVLAARCGAGRYASNNFFVVLPTRECSLDLHGLAALLNSRFITWYFRTVEPRQGRVFAELKIKHLNAFPLPRAIAEDGACGELNQLGKDRHDAAVERAEAGTEDERMRCERSCRDLDQKLERLVRTLYGLSAAEMSVLDRE